MSVCTDRPALTDAEILAKLPQRHASGEWTYALANHFNFAGKHRPTTTRLVYRALVRLEKRGLASREGLTASRLYIGWVQAKP